MSLLIYRTLKITLLNLIFDWQLQNTAKRLVFPKLNQLTNHFTPMLNAHFFSAGLDKYLVLQVNVTENNTILRNESENGIGYLITHRFGGHDKSLQKRLSSFQDTGMVPAEILK